MAVELRLFLGETALVKLELGRLLSCGLDADGHVPTDVDCGDNGGDSGWKGAA